MRKHTYFTAVVLILTLLLSACSSGSGTSSPSASGTPAPAAKAGNSELIIAMEQEPTGLDPNKVPAISSVRIFGLTYNSLTRMDENFNVVPNLAEKWDYTPDGKTLTFKLRQGVKFSNGREMTSDDVKYTYERILNPATGALSKSSFSSVDSIETPDKYTVVFKFKTADTAFLANSSSSNAAIVAKEVPDLNKEIVGTGPYMIDKIEPGQAIYLKKNPNYFEKDLPKVDKIQFRVMKDEAERLAALRAGRIDMSVVTQDAAKLLEGASKDIKVESYQSLDYSYIGLNVAKKPFDDVRVRQAISLAVNRDEIVQLVWKGQAVATGPISPANKTFALDVNQYPSYKKDIEKAKQLLKDAGYPNGFDTTIQTMASYPDLVDSAQVVQQQLKAIGINADIKKMEDAAYIDLWKSKKMDMMVGRNSSGTNPDRSLRFFFDTKGSANVWNWTNPAFDKLVADALQTPDLEKRKQLYNDAQKLVVNEAPNVFLVSQKIYYAVNTKFVKDFVPTAAGESLALLKTSVTGK
jgi:ABC-type transport system substrate-binding protein